MWTFLFYCGVLFRYASMASGRRRESRAFVQTHVESVAATAWGPDAVDAAEKPRERALPGTLRRAAAGGGALGLKPARGGWARPAGPRRRLARLESAAEPTAKSTADPKLTGTPSTRSGESGRGGHADSEAEAAAREQTPNTGKTTGKNHKKKPHRSSTSTAARSSRSARRRSSSSAGRRRACCCARTSPRGA